MKLVELVEDLKNEKIYCSLECFICIKTQVNQCSQRKSVFYGEKIDCLNQAMQKLYQNR